MFALNVPNVLTVLRILLVPVLVAALLVETPHGSTIAAIVFAAAALTDGLDGYIARSRDSVTTFGKIMDPVADKLLIAAALISLVSLDRLAAWVAMVIVAREFAVSGLRIYAGAQRVVIPASQLGRVKTVVQVAAVLALIAADPEALWVEALVYAMVAMTLVSGVDYFLNVRHRIEEAAGRRPQGRRSARTGAGPLLAGAAVAAFVLAAGHAPARAATGEPYGLVASNANFVPGATLAERTAAYRRLYDAGVRAIRLDISWHDIEPPGPPLDDYDFSARDREVRAITDAGLKVIGLLGYGHPDHSRLGGAVARTPLAGGIPPFSVGNANYFPPDDPRDFARYARAAAEHYGDEVIGWEVWNEENGGWRFWPPREDPAAYARLLCAAHDALKVADPDTPVVFGGVFFPAIAGLPGMSGPDFVRAAYRASPGLGRCFDALAYHPYPYPFTAPELDIPVRGSVLAAAGEMRRAMPPRDRSKPLWITEIGWPTHDRTYGVGEAKQAQYVARMQAATFAQGLPVLTWYTYGDSDDPTGANQEGWFGFFRPDGSAKPAHRALATFSRVFAGARFARDLSRRLGLPRGRLMTGGRGFALEYRRDDERIVALWYANESVAEGQGPLPGGGTLPPRSVRVRLPVASGAVRVVDHLGGERTVAATDGRVSLELGPSPVYVVEPR